MTTQKAVPLHASAAKGKIFLGSDHGGFTLKEHIKSFLEKRGYAVLDIGAYSYKKTDDYPDFAIPLAEHVAAVKDSFGILLCKSGQGACVAANKVRGARATQSWNEASACASRRDDDSNILCLGSDFLTKKTAETIIQAWLATPFSGLSRHSRRIKKITVYENNRD